MIGVIQATLTALVILVELAELTGLVQMEEEPFGLRQAVLLQKVILLALAARQAVEIRPLPA